MALTYDQISAITEKKFIPKMTDNIFKAIPLMMRLKKKQELLDGGTKVLVPLEYAQNAASGWYSGADTLDNTDSNIITAAEFNWAQIYTSISITRRDELMNSGDAQKVNFVKAKVKNAEKTITDLVATGCYNAGTDPKAIVGARAFVTTSSTYGGISQTDNSWWQAQSDSSTTTFSIGALQSLWGSCAINGEPPTLVTSTQANYDRYYAALQPQQRFMDVEMAKAGFTTLMFNGVPWLADSKCPTNYIYLFNENYLKLYVHRQENFRFEPFMKPINQNVQVAHIFAMMVLASSNNRMHGVMSAVAA